jgi:hypothetical protein
VHSANDVPTVRPQRRLHSVRCDIPDRCDVRFTPVATPKTRPLLYTALLRLPDRIDWLDAPVAPGYVADLRVAGARAVGRSDEAAMRIPPGLRVPAGEAVRWSIAPRDAPSLRVSGVFRLVSAPERDRLDRALARLEDVADPEYRAVVSAIVQAQVGLYQDALGILDNLLARGGICGKLSPGPVAMLAHRAGLWVLRSMKAAAGADLSPSARKWMELRSAYHADAMAAVRAPESGRLGAEPIALSRLPSVGRSMCVL